MQMRNGSIMAKAFQIILVFSFRGLFKNEDETFFQQVLSLFRSLNMIEFKTIFYGQWRYRGKKRGEYYEANLTRKQCQKPAQSY